MLDELRYRKGVKAHARALAGAMGQSYERLEMLLLAGIEGSHGGDSFLLPYGLDGYNWTAERPEAGVYIIHFNWEGASTAARPTFTVEASVSVTRALVLSITVSAAG